MAQAAVFKRIMLVLDGSEAAMMAAEVAVRMAVESSSHLVAISVIDTETLRQLLSKRILVSAEMQDFEAELEQSARRSLRFLEQLARENKVEVETVILKGSVHNVVVSEERKRRCDLIVMGSFQHSATQMDVAARERQLIMEEATCPVLLVK